MAWQKLTYRLTSDAPLIMHSGRMISPLDKFSRQMKQISGKRTKTEADLEAMAEIEFYAGLYIDASGPVIPQDVIDAMLVGAAKKLKEGPVAKSACFTDAPACLDYDGPRTAEELWKDERFRFVKPVRVGMAKVMRTRPIFETWSATVTLQYDPSLVNPARVDEWMRIAGAQIGLCDWRPRYGRFSVERISGNGK